MGSAVRYFNPSPFSVGAMVKQVNLLFRLIISYFVIFAANKL